MIWYLIRHKLQYMYAYIRVYNGVSFQLKIVFTVSFSKF